MFENYEDSVPAEVLLKALKQQQASEGNQVIKTLYSGTELLNMGIQEIPKLWEPFFPSRGVVGLTGSSDCGKSMFLRQLSMAIALQQKEFLGYPLHAKHGRTLYLCTEDDYEGIAALLHKQSGDLDPESLSNIHFMFDCTNLLSHLDEFLSFNSVDLIVLDVWSDTYIGNPNNWVDVRRNLSLIKELANKHQCLIAVIHHSVKNSEKSAPDKNKLNGSQAIEAKLRCLVELRIGDSPDERLLHVLKNNYMSNEEKSEGLVLQFHNEHLLFTNTGRKVSKSSVFGENGSKKYDSDSWIQRMNELRSQGGYSFEKARIILIKKYPEENVPGLTWFKNNCKPSGGQSLEAVNE